MLRSDLCNYSDPYIAVKGVITIVRPYGSKRNKKVAFKKDTPNCISEINGVNIDNAEDLDVVMPMYNWLEYNKNYRKTTGSLWSYYRDEPRILFLLILNLLNIKQVLLEILKTLVLVKMVMMPIKLVKWNWSCYSTKILK